jgi:threonine aldolase
VHVTYAVGVDSFSAGMTERITAPVGSTVTFDY